MPELSNVLRQRLGSVEEPQVHPDADTLTAYLETALTATDRRHVLEHLAACSQCREVMSLLSTPEFVTDCEATPVRLQQPRLWRSWRSAWGLAVSLAGLTVVTTLIVEMPRGTMHDKQAFIAPSSASTPAAPASSEPAATPSAASAFTGAASASPHDANASLNRRPNPSRPSAAERPAANTAEPVAGGPYVNVEMFGGEASYANYAAPSVPDLPSAPAPRLSSQIQNSLPLPNASPLTAAPAPYEMQSGRPLRVLTPAPNGTHIFGWSAVATIGNGAKRQLSRRLMPPINAYTFASSAMGGPGQLNPTNDRGSAEEGAMAPAPGGKDAGGLDRSHAFTARALANPVVIDGASDADDRKVAGVQQVWKVGDGKLWRLADSGSWMEAYPSEDGIQFSFVSSRGMDIWAGGRNAALVHSRDGGTSWERMTLGASATGTIHSIETANSKIVVRSSSGQSWFSADGGKTWALED